MRRGADEFGEARRDIADGEVPAGLRDDLERAGLEALDGGR